MSTNRTCKGYRFTGKTENGRPRCGWCGGEVPKPRRVFCTEACSHEHWLRNSPSYMRQAVFNRDKGVCSVCGLDTWALELEYRTLENNSRWHIPTSWKRERGIPEHRDSFWDADHIIPVVEGGGECDLSNMRTLCIPCHKKVSAELAARLKKPKKQNEQNTGQLSLGI